MKDYMRNKKMYVEINTPVFVEYGEVEIIGRPMTISTIIDTASVAPKGDFDIVYTNTLADFIELTGKRGAIVANILRHKDTNNYVWRVQKSLQKYGDYGDKNLSRSMLYKFLREAEDKNYLVVTRNGLMLNPKIMRRGSKAREIYLCNEYDDIRKQKNGDDAPDEPTLEGDKFLDI